MVLLLLLPAPLLAQEETVIEPGRPQVVELGTEGPVTLHYRAPGPQVVTICATAVDENDQLDTVLTVSGPGGRLTYADDVLTEQGIDFNACAQHLPLPAAGPYLLQVHSFNGAGVGNVHVLLLESDPYEARMESDPDGLTIHARLPRGARFRYTFAAEAGQVLTLTARDTGRTLDPLLLLRDAAGELLAFNDDHGSADSTLGTLDARISAFVVPEDGLLTAEVWDFLGAEGFFTLHIAAGE